jgi:hypothetical protein
MAYEPDLPDLTPEQLQVKAHAYREAGKMRVSPRLADSLLRLAKCYEIMAARTPPDNGMSR